MTEAEQLDHIRDILRPVVDVDGLSVEDAVRRVVEMVQHMPTNQDLLDAAVDAQSRTDKYAKIMRELEAERDAARAAVAEMRERAAKEADLRGGMTQGDDYDRGWARCALRVAAAIRALPLTTLEATP